VIHLFKGINQLTNLEVEKAFSNTKSNTLFDKDLFIDLSQIRFAQLSAINYLVLKIDSECKKGTIKTIYASLPTTEFTTGELNSSDPNFTPDLKSKILNNRRNSNSFIKNAKFLSALKQGVNIYDVEVYFTERYNFESEFKPNNFETAFEEVTDLETNKYLGYHYLYPLEWIFINDVTINYDIIEEKFNQVLENADRGLDSIDVNAIKNVIFSELSKNVQEHTSGKEEEKRFLLSIGLISTKSLKDNKEKKSIEYEFNDWVLEEQIQSLVEIYFGDTGGGFFNQQDFIAKCKQENVNEKKEQLRWAFKKWTTKKFDEERRGTKGLYRINRIVNNYNGIFHIITNDQNGGFRKGGLKNEKWLHRKTLSNFDGAFIQIKLCPYSAVREFKFTLKESESDKQWKTINIDTNREENEIIKFIHQEFKSESNLLSILDLDKNKSEEPEKINLLNNILLEISYNSHPSGAVVFINSSLAKDTIDTIINSINELIINKTSTDLSSEKDNEEIYDTVIVIHGNHTFWYGGNQHIINILNEVYENNFDKKIDELKSFQSLITEDKVRVRQSLENDNKLIHVNKNGQIELNFTNLDNHFCKIIKDKISLERQKESNKLISPKVEVLDYWLDVESILKDNEFGFGLALYLKALEYIKNHKQERFKQEQLYILIDHRQHIKLAKAIATLFGLNKKHLINLQDEIQNNSLRRFKLIPEKSNVIILTSIIGSSETIRRLVKYVRRDNANPILILCLSNHRKNKITKPETWGNITKIKSIYTEHEKEQPKVDKNKEYFEAKNETLKNSKFNLIQPNYTYTEWKDNELLSYELTLPLKESKSLNYNHIGINNDRHFTFYIDKYKLLNSKNIIWDSVIRNIEEWKSSNKITEFTLHVKDDFLYKEVSGFITFLKEKYNNVVIYKYLPKIEILDDLISFNIEKDLNVFIIDFGLISGNTINSMLCNFKGLNHLFICIIFNQSHYGNHDHYKRLTTLDNSGYRKTPTKLKIEFLFNFPLTHYNRETCPICNHIDALEYYKINDDEEDYMFRFSEDRQKRLTIRERDDVSREDYPFDFYYQYPDIREQELSSEIIAEMFNLKLLLEDSLDNTKSRIDLFHYVFDIYSNKEIYLLDCNSKLYSLIYYLSYEVHWLQKEPLVFRDFRDMLAEISIYVAVLDINKLTKIFKENNNHKISANDCATRYKYSAISLLRSTDKLKFCDNVGKIISSSKYIHRYSNNLLQNSFYHTFSIYKNKYNKSKKYFEHLIESYKIIINLKELSEEQKNTANKLYNLLSSKLVDFNIEKLDDIGIIKQLKKNYDEKYKTQSHPVLETNLSNISLTHISSEGLNDLTQNGEASEYYNSLFIPLSNIEPEWKFINHFIYTEIIPYYKKFSDGIKTSYTFKSDYILHGFFENIINENLDNLLDDFSRQISQLYAYPLNYLKIKKQYDINHKNLFDNLIKKESDLNDFIEQFPLKISEVIEIKRLKAIFPNLEINIDSIAEVFYPKSRFMKDISTIINSIKGRVLEEHKTEFETFGRFSNISFKINYTNDEKYVYLMISYNNTNSDNHPHKENENGGLETMRKELKNFGGDLIYEPMNNENGFFVLTFKFLIYEQF
jgi:hypothetical protein